VQFVDVALQLPWIPEHRAAVAALEAEAHKLDFCPKNKSSDLLFKRRLAFVVSRLDVDVHVFSRLELGVAHLAPEQVFFHVMSFVRLAVHENLFADVAAELKTRLDTIFSR